MKYNRKIEFEVKCLDEKGERYTVWIQVNGKLVSEVETDKENLRMIIETIDNQII